MPVEMTRRRFLSQTASLAAAAALPGAAVRALPARKKRPNIVLIVADDLGYGDAGCYGCEDIKTPAVDRLAREGVRFTDFYANAAECTPTRTALLTGRYQHRVGGLECALGIGNVGRYDDAIRLREKNEMGLPAEETTIARMLKDAGYRTALTGKWHLGYEPKFFPGRHGFDYSFGPIGGAVDYFHHIEYTGEPCLYKNGKVVKREGYLTELITEEAVAFIERQKDAPFFLYVPYTAPHTPYQGPGDGGGKPISQEDYNKGNRATYIAMVESMDRGIGKILGTLGARGFADDTLVVFMSDNGANKTGNNGPFSGYKGGLFEGGIRVPCVAKRPGVLPAGAVSDQPCLSLDFSLSILGAAGLAPPEGRPFDGRDILRSVETGEPIAKRPLFWRNRRGERTRKAVRHGHDKYIHNRDGDKVEEHLYNLESDPGEKDNLMKKRPRVAKRLKALLADWEREVKHSR